MVESEGYCVLDRSGILNQVLNSHSRESPTRDQFSFGNHYLKFHKMAISALVLDKKKGDKKEMCRSD